MSVVGEVIGEQGELFLEDRVEEVKEAKELCSESIAYPGASKDLLERQIWEHRTVEHQLHHKFDHKLGQQQEWNRLDQLGSRLGLLDPDVDGVDIEVMTIETFQMLISYLQENSSLSLSSFNLSKSYWESPPCRLSFCRNSSERWGWRHPSNQRGKCPCHNGNSLWKL